MMDLLISPLSFSFMQRALIIAVVVGSSCAVLSCYVVLRGWSLMGDAMSHAVLPGVVLASLVGLPLGIGAFFAGLLCALLTGFLHGTTRLREDTLLGIVFSGMLGLGMLLYVALKPDSHLTHILFGNLLGITPSDFWQAVVISIFVAAAILLKWRDFMVYVFDSAFARVIGLNVPMLHYGLLVLIALATVAALQATGVVLVIAMLIAPGITAQLICQRFSHMLFAAVVSAVLACIVGIYASFYLNASTSACIVLMQGALFMFALIFRSVAIHIKRHKLHLV